MDQKPSSIRRQNLPPVSWDAKTRTFSIVLSGLEGALVGDAVEAKWKPRYTYVIRIREADSGDWSFGFETPLTSCSFADLKPDSDYEVEVRSKDGQGESDPARISVRTTLEGKLQV